MYDRSTTNFVKSVERILIAGHLAEQCALRQRNVVIVRSQSSACFSGNSAAIRNRSSEMDFVVLICVSVC